MDKVADVLLTLQAGKVGSVEADRSELAERAIFDLRCFGEFQVRWGIGAYGKELNACLLRVSAYEKEEILASGARCLISNRIAYGLSMLKLGTFCMGKGGSETAILADFSPSAVGEMENRYFANAAMEPVGRYPPPIDFSKRSIRNQNLVWAMVFGAEHYHGREEALEFPMLRYEESPEFFTIPFLASIWERMTIDYAQKVTEGVRFLTQLGIKSDGL